MNTRKHSLILTIAFYVVITGCEILVNNGDGKDMARIIPGESVEGISLGATKQEVEAIFGEFKLSCQADGLFRNWYSANFFGAGESSSDGLMLYFIWGVEGDVNGIGPLDMIAIRAPYDGQTKEGIGIGSSLKSVRTAYGDPARIYPINHDGEQQTEYVYCLSRGRHFIINFTDGLATSISMGYFELIPRMKARAILIDP